jgi:hypothetical protein
MVEGEQQRRKLGTNGDKLGTNGDKRGTNSGQNGDKMGTNWGQKSEKKVPKWFYPYKYVEFGWPVEPFFGVIILILSFQASQPCILYDFIAKMTSFRILQVLSVIGQSRRPRRKLYQKSGQVRSYEFLRLSAPPYEF